MQQIVVLLTDFISTALKNCGSISTGVNLNTSSICALGSKVPSDGSTLISGKFISTSSSSVLDSIIVEKEEGCGPLFTRIAVYVLAC
jgi:hypothetical protein